MLTPPRRYKADYDGKQGDPYVRAKGKSKSQLDFASRFVASYSLHSMQPHTQPSLGSTPSRANARVLLYFVT
jgi:hypothetical protein